MTQLQQFTGGLLALGISLALYTGPSGASDTSPGFSIMSDAEVATHSAAMSALQGKSRDDYRNAQYEQLRSRALENGYRMPATPPWGVQVTDDRTAQAIARHAEMREKMQTEQNAAQQSADANLERLQEAVSAQQQEIHATLKASQQNAQQQIDAGQPAAAVQSTALAPAASSVPEASAAATAVAAAPAVQPPAVQPPAAQPPAAQPTVSTVPAVASEAAPPRFAPVEEQTSAAAEVPVAPAAPIAPAAPTPPSPPPGPYAVGTDGGVSRPETPSAAGIATTEGVGSYADSDAMNAYRESMRARFDEYMKERQAQQEEAIRRQREQHEAALEQNRTQMERNRAAPYPYPAAPGYGPRYPGAYPGYRTPYWQQ